MRSKKQGPKAGVITFLGPPAQPLTFLVVTAFLSYWGGQAGLVTLCYINSIFKSCQALNYSVLFKAIVLTQVTPF